MKTEQNEGVLLAIDSQGNFDAVVIKVSGDLGGEGDQEYFLTEANFRELNAAPNRYQITRTMIAFASALREGERRFVSLKEAKKAIFRAVVAAGNCLCDEGYVPLKEDRDQNMERAIIDIVRAFNSIRPGQYCWLRGAI